MTEKKVAPLTEKQKKFCTEYIYDWNATRAAKAAGYSEDTAGSIGHENLKKPEIQAYIQEIQKDLEKVAGISRLRIIQEHKNIIETSIAHLHNTWIERKEFDQLTKEQKSAIAELSYQTRRETIFTAKNPEGEIIAVDYIKIKLYDRQKSMDSISRMLGYDSADKIEISGGIKSYRIVPASQRNRTGNKPE
jgi:phage terminase small subunit